MAVTFTVDTEPLDAMQRFMGELTGQMDWITAKAMTRSAYTARRAIADEVFPRIKGGPTTWTRRGLLVRHAAPDNLVAMVGFNYGNKGQLTDQSGGTDLQQKGVGVPSGRYMERLASGGDRQPKSSELRLRRAGVIRANEFITPASGGIRIDSRGNVRASDYKQVLSRLRVEQEGSGGATTSARKRGQIDYFMRYGELGGDDARFIARRIGERPEGRTGKGSGNPGRPATARYPRGFVPALFVVESPNYDRMFNIQGIAIRAFSAAFPVEFEKELLREIARPAK